MSLIEVQTADIVKKQFSYKWRAYIGVFTSLVIIQLLGVLFSLNGTGSRGRGTTGYDIRIDYFNADMVLIFTIFWGFITAFLLTTKAYREDDFAFVTNRASSTFSTIAFLFTICGIGAITAILSGYLLKVITYFFLPGEEIFLAGGAVGPGVFIIGFLATTLSIFLFSSIGYLSGMIIQWNKMFVILLPVIVFGTLILLSRSGLSVDSFLFKFIFQESNFILFVIKTIAATTIFYALATLISNRLEVKQ
ncbi:hypothetical protein [Halobacillus litoralis]|uniref:hypothetical protein n=1 Tax=Halobacillus litoralis TaxID=45668 RepID=UPI0024915052|nr:hypothetical protein [Halobacillus litoralis]